MPRRWKRLERCSRSGLDQERDQRLKTQMLMGMGLGPAEWFIRLGESSTFLEVGKNKGNA